MKRPNPTRLLLAGLLIGVWPATGQAALLLADNFTATANVRAGALDHNIANRQSGPLATTNYTTGPGTNPNIQVGNTTTLRSGGDGNYLLIAGSARGSLNYNFNGASSAGGLEISFDLSAELNTSDATRWTAINIGLSQADQVTAINTTPIHFGILFRANGFVQAFDSAVTEIPGSSANQWAPSLQGGIDNFDNIRLVFTDSTDGNPFDGVGQTEIRVYSALMNGGSTPIYTYTKAGGGYANNYINFQSNNVGGIDNLVITQIPEPGSLLLLAYAGWLGRRRRN